MTTAAQLLALATEVIAERTLERETASGAHPVVVRIYRPVRSGREEGEQWVSKIEIIGLPDPGDVEQFPTVGTDSVAALISALQLAGGRLERHAGLRWGPLRPWYPVGYGSLEDAILR